MSSKRPVDAPWSRAEDAELKLLWAVRPVMTTHNIAQDLPGRTRREVLNRVRELELPPRYSYLYRPVARPSASKTLPARHLCAECRTPVRASVLSRVALCAACATPSRRDHAERSG